jgi:hypothetical protein
MMGYREGWTDYDYYSWFEDNMFPPDDEEDDDDGEEDYDRERV